MKWFSEILYKLGLVLFDKAATAVINKKIGQIVDGGSATGTGGTPSTDPQVLNYYLTIKQFLFSNGSIFRMYIDNIIHTIVELCSNINLSSRDILWSLNLAFKDVALTNMLYELYIGNHIAHKNKEGGKYETSLDETALDSVFGYCTKLFETRLSSSFVNYELQSTITGIPDRVLRHIDFAFRSRPSGIISKFIPTLDKDEHVIYSSENQKDIFGKELISGQPCIIKYKDNVSDVFCYAVALPKEAHFDNSISISKFTDDEAITSVVSRILSSNNCDLEVRAILPKDVDRFIRYFYS